MSYSLLSKNNITQYLATAIFSTCLALLLYCVPRSNFIFTCLLFAILFACYYFFVKKPALFSLKYCIMLAIVFRLIAVFCLPHLSDDYFRFIWDGKVFLNHTSPFAYTPGQYIAIHNDAEFNFLYKNLITESQEAFTAYPAVLQYIFGAAVFCFPKSIFGAVVIMKLFLFIAECFTIYGLYIFCKFKKLPVRNILWYALNPLIIAELTGNVHFEALLICFLVFCFYFLHKNNLWLTAFFWALAINTKLLPLMLAPLLLMYTGLWRFTKMALVACIVLVLTSIPFINTSLLAHLSDSVGKYYSLFEFNGSFYYLAARTAELFTDEDYTQWIATVLGFISFACILFISFFNFKKDAFLNKALFIFYVYFLCAAMVHPWYVSTIVMLSVFSRYKFAVVFSMLIPLSYFPYWLPEYNENMYIILAEYSLLFAFTFYELKMKTGTKNNFLNGISSFTLQKKNPVTDKNRMGL